jgi:agmatine deiminase
MRAASLIMLMAVACAGPQPKESASPPVPTDTDAPTDTEPSTTDRRVPAEWEPQAAVWLQWPRSYERSYEPAFAKMVAAMLNHEDVHVLTHDATTRASAESALADSGGLDAAVVAGGPSAAGFAITWHDVPNDSAWMRDNGPLYVLEAGELRVQDWGFDAWGGAFGPFPYDDDDAVPIEVGSYLGLPVDTVPLVHERGNVEVDGAGAAIVNWTVLGDPERNPGLLEADAVAALEEWFGADRVVLIEGAPSGDLTGGHVDGIARFVDVGKVVVADCSEASHCVAGDADDQIYDSAAAGLEAAGLEVERWPFPSKVTYQGYTFDTDYMNWLVGNGFVIAVGFGDPAADAEAQARLEGWFPGRTVYVIEMLDSWLAGGGVHCHTNDQPAIP